MQVQTERTKRNKLVAKKNNKRPKLSNSSMNIPMNIAVCFKSSIFLYVFQDQLEKPKVISLAWLTSTDGLFSK